MLQNIPGNDFLLKKTNICFQFHIIIIDILLVHVYRTQLANCLTRNKDKKKKIKTHHVTTI